MKIDKLFIGNKPDPERIAKDWVFLFLIFISFMFIGNAVAQTTCMGDGSATDLTCGLVGYWNFDDGLADHGSVTANDSSGNGNNGTLSGSPLPQWVTGENNIGQSLSFSGKNFVYVNDNSSLDQAGNITITFWAQVSNSFSGTMPIVNRSNEYGTIGAGDPGYRLYFSGTANNISIGFLGQTPFSQSTRQEQVSNVITDSSWHHVAMVYNGSGAGTVIFYVDSQQVGQANVGGGYGQLNLGTEPISIASGFQGSLDNIRIYNRALSFIEVRQIYRTEGNITTPIPNYNLTVTNAGAGTGTVTSNPSGINCGVTCSMPVEQGAQVTLTASADGVSNFAGWSGGGCSGTSSACTVTVSADTRVTATFNANAPGVTSETAKQWNVLINSVSGGTVTGITSEGVNPSLNCTNSGISTTACYLTVNANDQVTLTATPDPGFVFLNWNGSCTGSTNSCSFTAKGNTSIGALFNRTVSPGTYTLTVVNSGTGTGVTTSQDGKISCGGSPSVCSASYPVGTVVDLTATPAAGSNLIDVVPVTYDAFSQGSLTYMPYTMNTNTNVTVTFNDPLSVPTDPIATTVSSSQVHLTWQGSTATVMAVSYNIYRNGVLIAKTANNATTYDDTGLPANTTYFYNVSTNDVTGRTSLQSTPAIAQTQLASVPVSPVGPTCEAAGGNRCWYVDPNAAGSNDGSSWSNAWGSLSNISGVQPGDYVYFSGGSNYQIYTGINNGNWSSQGIPIQGTANNPVTYKTGQDAGHNGTVIFDGKGAMFWAGYPDYNNNTNSISNITFDGNVNGQRHMTVENYSYNLTVGDMASGVTWKYLNLGGPQIRFNGASNIDIDHCFKAPQAGENISFWIGISGAAAWSANSIHDNSIYVYRQNNAGGDGDDAVDYEAATDMYNNYIAGVPIDHYIGGQHQDGTQGCGSYNRIYNNTFVNMGNTGIFYDPYGCNSVSNVAVFNNLILYTDPNLLGYQSGMEMASFSTSQNYLVANNTVINYNNNEGASGLTYGTVFANNLSYDALGFADGLDYSSNVLNTSGNAVISDADPHFFNYVPPTSATRYFPYNFQLSASDTKFKGAGTNLSDYCTGANGAMNVGPALCQDMNGNPRPTTGPWDIGAYQYAPQTASTGTGSGDVSSNNMVTMYDAALALYDLSVSGTCSTLNSIPGACANAEMDGLGSGQAIDSTDVVDIAKKALGLN